MNKNEFQIFDLFSECVAAVRDGQVIYANPAAVRFFGRSIAGEQIQTVLPSSLTEFAGTHYTGSAQLCGQAVTVDAVLCGKVWIYTILLLEKSGDDEFLAAAGSAIRSQAAIIQLASAFLRPHIEDLENEKLTAYAAMLNRSCRQMLRLADHMALVSTELPDVHQAENCPVLDLVQLCSDLADVLQLFVPLQHIHLQLKVPEQPVLFAGPQERIQQMLLNILSNSMKYTPEGGTVTLQLTEASGGPCITISDTGCGISGDRLLNIFQAYRMPPAFSDSKQGVGLGLAAARRIAEYLGGTLLLESRVNEGTRVTIQLPDNTRRRDPVVREPAPPAPDSFSKILTELSDVLDYTSFYSQFDED